MCMINLTHEHFTPNFRRGTGGGSVGSIAGRKVRRAAWWSWEAGGQMTTTMTTTNG
jgi:hypothetical protein